MKQVLLEITDLQKYFPLKKTSLRQKVRPCVKANDGISLRIYEGETFGLVGESGCGKSTLGRVLLQLYPQTGGSIRYYGRSPNTFCPRYIRRDIARLAKAEDAPADALAREFGGLVTLPDRKAVADALLRDYRAGVALRRANTLPRKTSDTQIAVLTAARAASAARLDALRAQHTEDAAFARAEALRDDGIDLSRLTDSEMRLLRKDLQIIFQDPYSSLNPRMTAGQIIGEGLTAHGLCRKNGAALHAAVQHLMEQCGLAAHLLHRYPHRFSGGQRQRIGIARALALQPRFIVCDEAVSALDVSIQSQILNLLQDLKEQAGLTYLFISHDLSVVKYISDRIGVMYLGCLVELADTTELFAAPLHPYTRALLAAIPSTDNRTETPLPEGDVPNLATPPSGCKFHPRCPNASAICRVSPPVMIEVAPEHFVACHNAKKAGD